MLEPEDELDEEEDLPDPGDPLDEGEEGDLEEPESEDLEDLSVEQLLERDRVLQKDAESRSRQAGDEAEEDEPETRPADRGSSAPAPTRREELRKRYPRSPGLWS